MTPDQNSVLQRQIDVTGEMVDLRDAYVAARVVTARYADDALHVAQATLARADVIVSWNFKHLVNPVRIRGFNEVNAALRTYAGRHLDTCRRRGPVGE